MSLVFCLGFYIGTEKLGMYDPSLEIRSGLNRRPGLILTRLDTGMILLGNEKNLAGDPGFPRIISFPERPLQYQEASLGPTSAAITLPLEDKVPWFVQSILIDFSLIAREFNARFGRGLFSFLAYAGALLLLLACLRFLFELSTWPIANLFFGALIFRLVLSLVIFLNTREVLSFLASFVNKSIPEFMIIPMVFLILSTVLILYTLLAYFARRNRSNND